MGFVQENVPSFVSLSTLTFHRNGASLKRDFQSTIFDEILLIYIFNVKGLYAKINKPSLSSWHET